jgi:HAE1 family hydrophobic/amphiphilic exporter-1
VNNIAKNSLPDNISLAFRGQVERLEQNNYQVLITFGLALLFIYLVLSAQFESFTDPLIILFSVPFSIVGALLLLIITGNNLNIYSNIGLITLIGLVTKNAIMIVEFANQLQSQKEHIYDAIIKACKLRFRPILMTSMSTIFGAVPFILASGAGAEPRNAIGITVLGGMLIGTIFTLFIIPILYYLTKKPAH